MDIRNPLALPSWFAHCYRNCILRMRHAGSLEDAGPKVVTQPTPDHWLLFAVEKGVLRLRNYRFDCTLLSGYATLVPPGWGFQMQWGAEGIRSWLAGFDVQTTAQAANPLAMLDLPQPLPCRPGVMKACERLAGWVGGRPRCRGIEAIRGRIELDGILLELIGSAYAAGLLLESRHGPAPEWLHAVVEHLQRRFKPEDAKPRVLAKLSGYCADYVRHCFVRHFGETPERFQRKVRMGLASRMLRGNIEITVGEVAKRCGYGSYAQFARDFRRLIGVSPRSWRRGPEHPPAAPQTSVPKRKG
jgi:AraC-like DNA-binding protein